MKQAGLLAGVGLLFSYLLSMIPGAGWIFSIVGLVLFLVGVHKISQLTGQREIFNLFLLPVILGFVGITIASIMVIGSVMRTMMTGGFGIGSLGVTTILVIVVSVVLLIISLISYVKAYRLLAQVTNMNIFNTVANLYKWGAILLIVFGIGAILMFAGVIVAMVGFFSMEEKPVSQ
ncbi:MAG: DUF996 domain-containing protein [Pseudothermotoga sp.]|uniref:DUF996 domain-containing protein n=1 Tax=Pseudothermotoga sp. TaxID=2033661 RepID=UPI000E849C04|nr:DUF996 domain-containing protein [Pseudothermotoga sp.]MDK2923226.1 hypothetical protein [Pseudothermotoga sp.]HBT38808.1 hypothetical protein [Pseudothermotoga sp.]HCO97921.1 hypothetical protein [Pseudothermotoga sp.]